MRKKLKIPLSSGAIWETHGEVIGDLCIHPDPTDKNRWTVTHVPTLTTLKLVVPAALLEEKNGAGLCQWADRVQDGCQKEWAALRKLRHKDIVAGNKKTDQLRLAIRDHCKAIVD